MKGFMADLVDRIAEHDASTRDFFIRVEALQTVVTALVFFLDEERKKDIRQCINEALFTMESEDFQCIEDQEKLRQAIFQLIDRPLSQSLHLKQPF